VNYLKNYARWRGRLLAVALAWSGICCSRQPPVTSKVLPSSVVSRREEVLDPALLRAALGEREGEAYRVGPGDSLLVAIYGHPELSISQYSGTSLGHTPGLLVDADGTLQLPLLGSVQVAGKSVEQLRQYLETELTRFVNQPKVTVQVIFAGSIRYHLLGQFTNPGLKYSDRPMRLLEALSLGGSVELAQASLRTAYLARAGRRLPVNFQRLIIDGDLSQNVRLRSGDIVVVPDRQYEQAYIFGGSEDNPRGGAVQFDGGRLTLLQALAKVGFGWKDQFQGRLSDTRVIRSEGDRAELFIVDAEAIFEGKAGPFDLAPGDVVYVPATALTDWNQALSQLLPTLQTVSGVLNPFVQIKYLSE
jgi:polysaccharide biosynthesis/export protein